MLQGTLDPSLGDTVPPLPPLQHSKVGKEVVGAHPELAFLTNPLPVPCTMHLSWEAWGCWPWDSRKGWMSLLGALSPPSPQAGLQTGRRHCAKNAAQGCGRVYDAGQEVWPLRDSGHDAGCSLSTPPALHAFPPISCPEALLKANVHPPS